MALPAPRVDTPQYYWPMFVSVLIMNTAFAADAFRVGRAKQRAPAGGAVSAA